MVRFVDGAGGRKTTADGKLGPASKNGAIRAGACRACSGSSFGEKSSRPGNIRPPTAVNDGGSENTIAGVHLGSSVENRMAWVVSLMKDVTHFVRVAASFLQILHSWASIRFLQFVVSEEDEELRNE